MLTCFLAEDFAVLFVPFMLFVEKLVELVLNSSIIKYFLEHTVQKDCDNSAKKKIITA